MLRKEKTSRLKGLGIITFSFLHMMHLAMSINMECRYHINNWTYLDNIYWCGVINELSIKSNETSVIKSVSGTHTSGKGIGDVRAFSITGKTVNFFPKGIDKIFKHLQGIQIYNSSLQELTKSDFSVFPELVYLSLNYNNLQILEQGLFDYNSKLKVIYLASNKISQVHPSVFDNLKQLMSLYLESNICISMNAEHNSPEIQRVIQKIKSSCPYTSCSQTKELSKALDIFRTNSTKQFKAIDEEMRSLVSSNAEIEQNCSSVLNEVTNFKKQMMNDIKELYVIVYNKLESSWNKNMTKNDFEEVKTASATKYEANSTIKDTAIENIKEELKDEMQNIVERFDNFICETAVRLQKIETTLNRQYSMMMNINVRLMAEVQKMIVSTIEQNLVKQEKLF